MKKKDIKNEMCVYTGTLYCAQAQLRSALMEFANELDKTFWGRMFWKIANLLGRIKK